jgi:alkylation response protein AidB-like acyl-CoA dehydrogenase
VDFSLSEDQVLLRDTARALFTKECPPEVLRAHIDDPSVADALWHHIREFTALADGPCTDLSLFAEEAGYVAAPGPFFATTALFAPVAAAVGSDLHEGAVAGELTGTVALAGADGVWRVSTDPVKTFVPEADRVDWVAIVTPGPEVVIVPGGELPTRFVKTVDFSRRLFEVDTTGVSGAHHGLDERALASIIEAATIVLAAETVGVARRMFDMALAYAKERYQFDVPIGSFQAIQHKLADTSLAVERATAAVHYAAMTVDADDADRHRATHVAKAAAGTAAMTAAKDSIQVHGGIGYTWEHDLQLFIRRATGAEHWMGTTDWHHDRLADLLLA